MPYIGRSENFGVRSRFQYQATASQTSFSGSDANSLTLSYNDSRYMDVYQNGVLLVPGTDYAATTGTTVVLVTGASANDIIEMVVYDVFTVANSYTKNESDTRYPSQLNVDTIVDKAGSGGTNVKIGNTSTYVSDGGAKTQNTVQALIKCWFNYKGTDDVFRDTFNVASSTDNGTGYYTITFTNAMSNDDYSRTCCAGENANTGGNRVAGLRLPATGSFNIVIYNTSGGINDVADLCGSTQGDLA
jgi:hypothetical protein